MLNLQEWLVLQIRKLQNNFLKYQLSLLQEKGYMKEQIFNADETDWFYKKKLAGKPIEGQWHFG